MLGILAQIALASAGLAAATGESRLASTPAIVEVDSARHTVTIRLGRFRVEPGSTQANFGRRQLLKPTPERVVAFGAETGDMSLPRTVGIPMRRGMPLAVTVGWYNGSAETHDGVQLAIVIDWIPASTAARPLSVYPVSMDVMGAQGESSGYDLPRGVTRQAIAFEMPVSGHVIAAGGHLHDYGRTLEVDDISGRTARPLFSLASVRDDDGRVREVTRITPGIRGRGIAMKAGRTYSVSASNDNPTGATLRDHAMAYVAFLYAPTDNAHWPTADPSDPAWKAELRYLFGNH